MARISSCKVAGQPRKFLVVMCGLPASGKTTLATRIALLMEKAGIPTVVLGSDNVRSMMPIYREKFDPAREPLVRDATLHLAEYFLRRGVSVVNDDMNYYSSMRHDMVELARRTGAIHAIIHVEASLEDALKWNEARGSPIPPEVIASVNEKFEEPGKRYRWDRSLARFNLSRTPLEHAAREALSRILALKPEDGEAERRPPGLAEEIDKVTRRVVSEAVKSAPRSAVALSNVRRSFVREALKAGLTPEEAEAAFRRKVEEALNELDSKGR
ncbi:MAG: AAA family ATPase [Candidatus Freyarchaeota archaeon]